MSFCKIDIEIAEINKIGEIVTNSFPFTSVNKDVLTIHNPSKTEEIVSSINKRLSEEYGKPFNFLDTIVNGSALIKVPDDLVESTYQEYLKQINYEKDKLEKADQEKNDEGNVKIVDGEILANDKSRQLLSFLYKLNPNFDIKLIKDLSEEGLAYISNFEIRIRNNEALSEEVAHFFFELLPEGEFKEQMMNNISKFEIYQDTLKKYKKDKEYKNEDGSINYYKIKSEAAAKLIAEYTDAVYKQDINKLKELEKPKFSLKKWIKNYKNWFTSPINENIIKAYKEAAIMILEQDTSLLDISIAEGKGVFKKKGYYGQTTAMAVAEAVKSTNNLKLLKATLDNVRKELKNITKSIEKSELKEKINNALNAENLPKIEQLLADINKIKINNNENSANELLDVANSFTDFLEIMSDYKELYKGLEHIMKTDELSDDYLNNIKEIQFYRKMYKNLISLFDNNLQTVLKKSKVDSVQITEIMSILSNFKSLDGIIMNKLRDNIEKHLLENFEDVNSAIVKQIEEDIKILEKDPINNALIIEKRRELQEKTQITSDFINDLLDGLGEDMTDISAVSYNIMAAVKNGDVFVSKMANNIANKRKVHQLKATSNFNIFKLTIDNILTKLGAKGIDIYKIGKTLSQIDDRIDKKIKEGKRKVLVFLNPHKGANFKLDSLRNEVDTLRKNWKETLKQEDKDLFHQKRNELLKLQYNHWNSIYKGEFKEFKYRWDSNNLFYEAFLEMKELNSVINILEKQLKTSVSDNDNLKIQIIDTKLEKARLFSEDGKQGEELEKTKLLKQYFEESKKFKEVNIEQSDKNIETKIAQYKTELYYIMEELINNSKDNLAQISDLKYALLKKYGNDYSVEMIIQRIVLSNNIDYTDTLSQKNVTYFDENQIEDIITSLSDNYRGRLFKEMPNDLYRKEVIEDIFLENLKKLTKDNAYIESLLKIRKKREELIKPIRNSLGEADLKMLPLEQRNMFIKIERLLMTYSSLKYSEEIDYGIVSAENAAMILNTLFESILNNDVKGEKEAEKSLNDIAEQVKYIFDENYYNLSEEEIERLDNLKELFAYIFTDESEEYGSDKEFTELYWEELAQLPIILEQYYNQNPSKQFSSSLNLELINYIDSRNINGIFSFFNEPAIINFLSDEYFEGSTNNDVISNYRNWFLDNHMFKSQYVKTNEADEDGHFAVDRMETYTPLNVYTYRIPIQDKYKTIKYASNVVSSKTKKEYLTTKQDWESTENEENWNINNRGEWLPMTISQLKEQHGKDWEKYKTYINEDFYKMKQDADFYQLWKQKMKYYFTEQKKADDKLKSWYDVPVIDQDAYESKKRMLNNAPDVGKEILNKLKNAFNKKSNTDEEYKAQNQIEGFSKKQDYDYEGIVFNDSDISLGMFSKTPIERISMNTINALFQYSLEAEDYDARKELDEFMSPLLEIMKTSLSINHKGQKKRIETLSKLRSQTIAKDIPDNIFNSPTARRIVNGVLTFSGLKLTADIMGGMTNFIQANVNNMIESFASKHLGVFNYATGLKKASTALMEITADFGKTKNLSFWSLMNEEWDFVQGDFVDDISGKTSIKGKAFDFTSYLMIPRTAGEIHAQMAMGIGMMDKHPSILNEDGKEYKVYELYEIKNGVLELKEGFPKSWDFKGKDFLNLRNLIHNVNMELHGNYSNFNQTELSRHGLGKIIESMKRWYTLAISRRLSVNETFDTATNSFTEGYYVTAVKALVNILGSATGLRQQSFSSTLQWYTSSESKKRNIFRASADLGIGMFMYLIYTLGFGWDEDDPEKWEKLKDKNYLNKVALIIMLRSTAEHTSLIPFPGFGFQEMKRNILTPWSLTSDVISNTAAIAELGLYHTGELVGIDNDRKLYYQKDTKAIFGDKGDAKIIRYMMKMFGYTGQQIEPDVWLKNWVNMQSRLK